jgi:hypothetical protein
LLQGLNYNLAPDRSPQVVLAIPKIGKSSDGYFHCYLPTEEETHSPLHIHADFLLDTSRKHINFNERYNKKLLEIAVTELLKYLENNHQKFSINVICEILMSKHDKLREELKRQLSTESLAKIIRTILIERNPTFFEINTIYSLIY